MTKRFYTAAAILAVTAFGASAQLNSSVSVEGEYLPLVIDTERLNAFPKGYRFELPPASLNYEMEGLVTDFRPDILTMGVSPRQAQWPLKKRRGFLDARLGSYLNSRIHAGAYVVSDSKNSLLADFKFRTDAYKDLYVDADPERKTLFGGALGLHYTLSPTGNSTFHANAVGEYRSFAHGAKEWSLETGTGYSVKFAEKNKFSIDAQGVFFFPHRIFNNYGNVSLNPVYGYSHDGFALKAGANINLTYDARGASSADKFGLVHVSPDVSVQYRLPHRIGFFLSATGGVDTSPCRLLFISQPVYTPVDARFGLEAGPFAGFRGGATVRYAVARNVALDAWNPAYPGGEAIIANLHGMSVALNLHYSYGTTVELGLEGSYSPQDGTEGIFNGLDRPRWILDAEATVRPVKRLKIHLGYTYRGVRSAFSPAISAPADNRLTATRLPDITDLKAGITYSILDNLDVYAKGENLLNRRIDLLPGIGSEGLAVSGGLYLEF